MRILIVLTFYRPHTSGLTIYAERLARALVARGNQVTVLTSHYKKDLPYEEVQDGIRIIRAPVLARISKGVIMPTFGIIANRLVAQSDAIQLHLPQFDAAGIALRGRLLKIPTVITYHCDLRMPPGLLSLAANIAVRAMNNLAALSTHKIVTYTRDYAENSSYLRKYLNKLEVILPPVELPPVTSEDITAFAAEHNPHNQHPIIGMAARFATEKGVQVLLDALPRVFEAFPNSAVHFAGPYQNIIGEENYFERLIPRIRDYEARGRWRFVGELNPQQMAAFYPNIDLLTLPSLNATEAFGLVQIEAMLNGVPCVASNLPGVRQPVKLHHMGQIAPIGDPHALAQAIIDTLKNRQQYNTNPAVIAKDYLPDTVAARYEELFLQIKTRLAGRIQPTSS